MINNKVKFTILIIPIVLIMITTGCSISFKSNENPVNDAGVYKTETKGDSWTQRVLIPTTSGRPKSIGTVNVNFLVMDPSDNKAIYLGSESSGLLYTYDGANNWQVATGLGQRKINAVAVDPNSKCTIYAAFSNQVYKSLDCNRTWERIYIDNSNKTEINTVAIDHYDSNFLYIGLSNGNLIKSYDQGETWQTIKKFKNNIKRIILSPHDSRIIFIVTKNSIFRSNDGGFNWDNLNENLKEFKGGSAYRDMIVSEIESGLIFYASDYGLLKSVDYGDSWTDIGLITPSKGTTINAITVNPKDISEIYYVTNTTFYRSLDGGETWTPKKLPTTGAGWKLLIDPKKPNIIYMGVKKMKKNNIMRI